jgi:TolB-like protein/DNA-binding winged helix-turn-helix (wHTH) protein/Tfp pilus assembly protein PilF
MEERPAPQIACFGIFEVDLRVRELHKRGLKVKLQEQPFQVLAALLEHPGEVVTREALRQRIWPADTFVDFDNGLNGAINRLREALGDLADSPRFVETLPRRGYRFIAPVDKKVDSLPEQTGGNRVVARIERRWPLAVGGVAAAILLAIMLFGLNVAGLRDRLLSRTAPRSIQSIAVLPLENVSGDSSQEYFADGLTEALITNLGKLGELRVISRTSVLPYKGARKSLPQIARELNVDAVVEGAVLRSGDRVRLTVRLIRLTPEKQLWAESYDRDIGGIFALYGDLTRDIAHEIQFRLAPYEQMGSASAGRKIDPGAYDLYLKGIYEASNWNEEATRNAIESLERAVQLDPGYAEAWAVLSEEYELMGVFDWWPKEVGRSKAMQAAVKAIDLDEKLGKAHAALAGLMYDNWEWDVARTHTQRAIALDPSDADAHQLYGYYLLATGRQNEAVAEMKRALELDPLATNKINSLGGALYAAGRDDEALEQIRKVPDNDINSETRHRRLAVIYQRKGMPDEAFRELTAAAAITRKKGFGPVLELIYRSSGYEAAYKTYLREDIKQLLKMKSGLARVVRIAQDYAALGERDKTFEWLEKAFPEHDPGMDRLKWPAFESLRDDPRFQDLLRRMNLPP